MLTPSDVKTPNPLSLSLSLPSSQTHRSHFSLFSATSYTIIFFSRAPFSLNSVQIFYFNPFFLPFPLLLHLFTHLFLQFLFSGRFCVFFSSFISSGFIHFSLRILNWREPTFNYVVLGGGF